MNPIPIFFIILAFIVSINPYFWSYGLTLYVLGISFAWMTEGSKKSKLIWSFLPISLTLMYYSSLIIIFYNINNR